MVPDPGSRPRAQDTRGPRAPARRHRRACAHQLRRMSYARGTMADRRVLDTTELFGALPPDDARAACARRRRSGRSPQGRPAVPAGRRRRTSCSCIVRRAHRDLHPVDRRPRVGGRGAGGGRPVRRDGPLRRRAPLGRRPRARPTRELVVLAYDAVRAALERAPDAAVGDRAAPGPAPPRAPTRRSPTRCSSTSPAAPRSGCSSSPATPTSSSCR